MNIQEATNAINLLFPNRYFNIVECSIIGSACLQIEFANSNSSNSPNNIIMNHSAYMRFLCSSIDVNSKGPDALNQPQEMERIVSHYKLKDSGLKFRKIKAKNADEALSKLVKWFTSNQDIILKSSEI